MTGVQTCALPIFQEEQDLQKRIVDKKQILKRLEQQPTWWYILIGVGTLLLLTLTVLMWLMWRVRRLQR